MSTQATAPVTPERIYQLAFAYAPPLVLEAAISTASLTFSTAVQNPFMKLATQRAHRSAGWLRS
jgi:hypothetical protein